MLNAEQLTKLDLDLLMKRLANRTELAADKYQVLTVTSGQFYEYEKRFSVFSETKLTQAAQKELELNLLREWNKTHPGKWSQQTVINTIICLKPKI